MKTIGSLAVSASLLILSGVSTASASTCKIKTVEYSDGWLSPEMHQIFKEKGYTLVHSFLYEEVESDYALNYKLETVGVWPCGPRGKRSCSGTKRFATFTLTSANNPGAPLISLELGSKNKSFTELQADMERAVEPLLLKKLQNCTP